MTSATDVRSALDAVRDPELDQPVTELGFVADVRVDGAQVQVDLRLPTYFCAPNFAWTMAADAQARVGAVPGVERVVVTLLDHMSAGEINAGVAAGRSFDDAFPGLADGSELAELRAQFQRKAFVMRQEQVARRLLDAGVPVERLGALQLADLDGVEGTARYRELRDQLGFACDAAAPLLLDAHGTPVPPADVARMLARSRLTRVSVEGNADYCQGLLATRSDHDAVLGATDARELPDPGNPLLPRSIPA